MNDQRPQYPSPPPPPGRFPPPELRLPQPRLPDPGQPPGKMPMGIKILIAAAVALSLAVTIGIASYKPSGHAGAGVHSVTYQVDGTGGAVSGLITMQTPTGQAQANADLPMQTQDGRWVVFTDFQSGDFLYVSAQNQEETGAVTCRILVDGVKVSENTSQGGFSIATCQARAGW